MEVPSKLKKDLFILAAIGILSSILGGTMPIDVGNKVLSTKEAWISGIAPAMIFFGVALAILAYFLLKGAAWSKWPIICWLPINFLVGYIILTVSGHEISIVELLLMVLPVIIVWQWFVVRLFKRKETMEYLSIIQRNEGC